jgi:C1A family cysteine protease
VIFDYLRILDESTLHKTVKEGTMKTRNNRSLLSGLLIFLTLFLVIGVTGAGAKDELQSLRGQLNSRGASWKAGETSVSKLQPPQRAYLLGSLTPIVSPRHRFLENEQRHAKGIMAAPASLDWRNYGGNNYVTPVRSQGNCGSCWAFAATGALESQALIDGNTPGTDVNLSEQILVSCSGAGSCSGGYIDSASDYVRDVGLPEEGCFPYTATDNSCSNACSEWQSNSFGISGWLWATTWSPTVAALKNGLYTYGPLITTMDVYADFYYYTSGVYSHTSGTYQGGHAILLVGYNDVGQYFVVKNSWGTDWGEAGYFRIAYSELTSVTQFGAYAIAYDRYEGPQSPPAATCSYTVAPTSGTFASAGGSGTASVTAGTGCSWTAKSNVSWLKITAGAQGTGPGNVSYTASRNTSKNSRTGTMTIAGQTFTVTQSGTKTR